MPLELIPNQPFLFQKAIYDQPCLNSDTNDYGQLVAPNDDICIQQKMLPCFPDVLCNPEMYEEGTDIIDTWTVADGWSTSGATAVAFDSSTSGGGDVCEQSWGTLIPGVVYRLRFEITSRTGDVEVFTSLGNDGGETYTGLGFFDTYLIPQGASNDLRFIASFTSGGTIDIENISFQQWVNDCWQDALNTGADVNTWNYEFDETTQTGKFCASDLGAVADLINNAAYVNNGNYHRVSITVTDCTQGYLEIILGGVYFGSTFSNGEFTFYGKPLNFDNTRD